MQVLQLSSTVYLMALSFKEIVNSRSGKKVMINNKFYQHKIWQFLVLGLLISSFSPVNAQEEAENNYSLQITVNSEQDLLIPDENLTLREAILLVNGTLALADLTDAEQAQIQVSSEKENKINFDLSTDETIIYLDSLLPPLTRSNLIIDGTNTEEETVNFQPTVAITPNPEQTILRGLTILADEITIKGLSLYGFTSPVRETAATPAGDIVIASQVLSQQKNTVAQRTIPQNIIIEDNWLGVAPEQEVITQFSAFGVTVFEGKKVTIQNNLIANHSGSGIITGVNAEELRIESNTIIDNGLTGIPDAIRLEGQINNTEISNNKIINNAGSGIFLFKTKGATVITDNEIIGNGLRFKRAGIYLMGNDHQVTNNIINNHNGAGVVVSAYPESRRNFILNNRFANLDGLSIDLVTRNQTRVQDYQSGDGVNPIRDTRNRRQDTGNAAINAPQFLAQEFYRIGEMTNIDGIADPGSTISLYKVAEDGQYGPLSEPIAEVVTDEDGQFEATLELQPGEIISAIATLPEYGTSEPARNAVILSLKQF